MRRLMFSLVLAAAIAPAALALPNAMHPELGAKLAGKYEVPKGSLSAQGIVNVTLNASSGKVCWTFDLAGVAKPAFAHIHKGRAGTSGPVFIAFGKAYRAKGCTTASRKAIDAVESN